MSSRGAAAKINITRKYRKHVTFLEKKVELTRLLREYWNNHLDNHVELKLYMQKKSLFDPRKKNHEK